MEKLLSLNLNPDHHHIIFLKQQTLFFRNIRSYATAGSKQFYLNKTSELVIMDIKTWTDLLSQDMIQTGICWALWAEPSWCRLLTLLWLVDRWRPLFALTVFPLPISSDVEVWARLLSLLQPQLGCGIAFWITFNSGSPCTHSGAEQGHQKLCADGRAECRQTEITYKTMSQRIL